MTLSIGELYNFINFGEAIISNASMIQDNFEMDVGSIKYNKSGPIISKVRITFVGVQTFTDAYFSTKEKILNRLNKNYRCTYAKISSKNELVIDDVLVISCKEIYLKEYFN